MVNTCPQANKQAADARADVSKAAAGNGTAMEHADHGGTEAEAGTDGSQGLVAGKEPRVKGGEGGQGGEPDGSAPVSIGICYNCGSTKHRLAHCPQPRKQGTLRVEMNEVEERHVLLHLTADRTGAMNPVT